VVLGESILALAAAFFIGQLIVERRRAETALQKANAYLGQRVQRRTADLRFAYGSLQKEMFKRQKQETLQRRVEQSLFQAERLASIGTVTAGIVHNLRNPLTSILGFAELLKAQHPNLSQVDQVVSGAKQMSVIIDNLMARSRLKQTEEWVYLDALLKRELEFLEVDKHFRKGVKTSVDFEDDLPPVWGIYTDFSQVFSNLLHNALDAVYGLDNPVIQVHIWHEGNVVGVSVTDSGCGIEEEHKTQLYTPFFTTKNKADDSDGQTGTGLGLYMVKRLLDNYNADIDVDSTKGLGTTFCVSIPVAREMGSKKIPDLEAAYSQ